MKNWEDDDDSEYCSTRQDLVDVASVCDVIGIDLEVVNFQRRIQGPRVRRLLRRVRGRAHAQPGRAVQLRDQVPLLPRPRHAARRRTYRHRPLRPGAPRTNDSRSEYQLLKAEDGTRTRATSSTGSTRSSSRRRCSPLGALYKREVRKDRRRGRAARGREEGLHRHLLPSASALPRVPDALPADPAGRDPRLDDGRLLGEHQGLMLPTPSARGRPGTSAALQGQPGRGGRT